MQYTTHTIRLNTGELFNFKRRFKKHQTSLLIELQQVKDGRQDQGKRHQLETILLILFGGMIAGYTTLEDCHLWAMVNKKWLFKQVDCKHGIPVATTLSRAIQVCDIETLIAAGNRWRQILHGKQEEETASIDGKTMRGVHGDGVIRHILSLFTHKGKQILGQEAVDDKENEIPAARRLFGKMDIAGLLIIADALHTQKDTIKEIRNNHAHYLLQVKDNQKELKEALAVYFNDAASKREYYSYQDNRRQRTITTEVAVSSDQEMLDYLSDDWQDIQLIVKVHRSGTRKDTQIDETTYYIASKKLTAEKTAAITRGHWGIENNLHWVKDVVFLEDRQTVRKNHAPQVMTFLRSLCISVFALFQFASVSRTIKNFQMNRSLHYAFLQQAAIV
jgi:predicted transposase YbfD/YdcC